MPEWFADERFWEDLFPFEFGATEIAAGETQVERVITLSGVERGDVLDLGCGPGRHAVAFAKRGFRVTGVDLSAFHLGKAREHAAHARVAIDFVESDMRAFVRPGTFDLALSFFTSFGYFEDAADDLRVLRNVHASLRAGGTLFMELLSKERMARVMEPTVSYRLPDGSIRVSRHEIVDDWTRIKNEWLFIKGDRVRRYELLLRVYSGQELKTLLDTAGFRTVRLHGALDGRPYGAGAERLIAVATT
jgi:SAM-dependent methyltransferase